MNTTTAAPGTPIALYSDSDASAHKAPSHLLGFCEAQGAYGAADSSSASNAKKQRSPNAISSNADYARNVDTS